MANVNLGPVACVVGGELPGTVAILLNTVICTNGSTWGTAPTTLAQPGTLATAVYGVGDIGILSMTSTLLAQWDILSIDNNNSLVHVSQMSFQPSPFVVSPYVGAPLVKLGYTVSIPLNGLFLLLTGLGTTCVFGTSTQCWSSGLWIPSNCTTGRVDSTSVALSNGQWCILGGFSQLDSNIDPIRLNSTMCTDTGTSCLVQIPVSFPTSIIAATNVTINGLPCVVGGGIGNLSWSKVTWCANESSTGNIANWIPFPALNIPRTYHSSFIITSPSIITFPTSSPTTTPTAAPTSPTWSPTSTPTGVNYGKTTVVSQWTTFQYLFQSSLLLLWKFSNGVEKYGSNIALPPFTFAIGEVTCNVTRSTNGGAPTGVFSTFRFAVVGSAPVVAVKGGNTQILTGSSVRLSANTSYDPNVPNSTAIDLDYNWTVDGVPSTIHSPFLTISTVELPPLTTVTVMLTATSRLTSLWVAVTTELRVVAIPFISNITITGLNFFVSKSDQLRLLASVTNLGKLSSFDWSVQPTFPPSSSSSCNLPSVSSLTSTRALVLSGKCLEQGTTYRFTFTVGDDSMNTAQSWINVTVARPPSGGNCAVSSQTGVALTTLFHIECTGWMDYYNGSSLTYSLKQSSLSSSSAGTMAVLALSPRQYQGTFDVVLNSNDDGSALNGQITSVQLMVVISGGGGDVQWDFDPITLTPLQQCPSSSASTSDDLQYMTTVLGSTEFRLCGLTQRQTEWQTLWNEVTQIVDNLDYMDADYMAFLARSLQTLVSAAQSGTVNASSHFTLVLSDLVERLLSVGETTQISTQSTLSALPDALSCGEILQSSLLSALQLKLADLGEGRLPGEASVVLQTPLKISATTATFFSDESKSMGSASLSIGLPTELLDRSGAVSRVTVIDYGDAFAHCRMGNNDLKPISSVVDITLLHNDAGVGSSTVSVQGLSQGFSFSTQVTTDASCGKPVCAWWQPSISTLNAGEWSRDGCFTVGSTPDAPDNVTCTCTHLTEFSLILRPGCVNATYRALYYLALAGYATIFTVIVTKVSYRQWKLRKHTSGKTVNVVLWQHLMLTILCIARIVGCAMLATNFQDWNVSNRAVVLLIPFMIEFWVFTLIAFQWASIHHFGMQTNTPFVRVRALFILTNVLIVGCVIATIAVISSASPSFESTTSKSTSSQGKAETVVPVAAGVISVVTFCTAVSFLGYAIPLYRNLKGANNVGRHKVLVGALVLCSLLLLQSFLHLATAVDRRGKEAIVGGDVSEVVELIADLFCIATLLALYHQSLHNASSSTSTSASQNQHGSIKTDNKINLDTTLSLELSKRN